MWHQAMQATQGEATGYLPASHSSHEALTLSKYCTVQHYEAAVGLT